MTFQESYRCALLFLVLAACGVEGVFVPGYVHPDGEPPSTPPAGQTRSPSLDLSSICRDLPAVRAPLDETRWGEALWKPLIADNIVEYVRLRGLTTTDQVGHASQVPLINDLHEPERMRRAIREFLGDSLKNTCVPILPKLDAHDLGLTEAQKELAHIHPFEDGSGFYQEPWLVMANGNPPRETRVRVLRLTMQNLIGNQSQAFVLVPTSPGPHPVTLVAHQTLAKCGAREPVGACTPEEDGLPWQALAMKLAGDGFIVIAPDMIGYGSAYDPAVLVSEYDSKEMQRIRQYFPNISVMAVEMIQLERFVKALYQLGDAGHFKIKGKKIAIAGHSKGGYLAVLFAALYPEFVKIVFSSAGAFNYPLKGPYGDDLGFTEAKPLLLGIDGRICGWGYSQAECAFAGRNQRYLAIDFPVLVRAMLGQGQAVYLIAIEDDRLYRIPAVEQIRLAGEEGARQARLVGGEFWYGIVESGLRDGDGSACRVKAEIQHEQNQLACEDEPEETDREFCSGKSDHDYYREIFFCQLVHGRNHGIYYDHVNRGLDAIRRVMQTDVVRDFTGEVYRSNGSPRNYQSF